MLRENTHAVMQSLKSSINRSKMRQVRWCFSLVCVVSVQLFHNLQRVEEEMQSCDRLVAPPVPQRPGPHTSSRPSAAAAVAAAAAAAAAAAHHDDDDDRCANDDDDYLQLQEEEEQDDDAEKEAGDTLPPISQRRRNLVPGQVSMPESMLPPRLMPRKQSCPDTAATSSSFRASKPIPKTTGEPADSVKPKPPPPVSARKKK